MFAGIELSGENSLSLYSSLRLSEDDINVVIMHGDISEGAGEDKIKLPLLKDKNIDYLALGHIHRSYAKSLGSRGIARYSGCLEGRGFDETGEKGFYEVTVDENEKGSIPSLRRFPQGRFTATKSTCRPPKIRPTFIRS